MSGPGSEEPRPAPVTRGWQWAFVLAMLGVSAAWFGPLQVLLPAQAQQIAGAVGPGKEHLLTAVTAIGAGASIVATPLWGLLADRRARSGHPSRREIILAGAVVGALGLVILAQATTPAWMVAGWAVSQAGIGGPLAALGALIAEQVPPKQRGLVSSLFGIAQVAGVVLGTVVATVTDAGPLGYVCLAAALPLLCASLWIAQRGSRERRPAQPSPKGLADGPAAGSTTATRPPRPGGGRREPASRDRGRLSAGRLTITREFAWMWGVRFLLNVSNAMIVVYLYFFVADGLHIADVTTWVLIATLLNVLFTCGVGALAGLASDRSGRRLPYAAWGGLATAFSALLLAVAPNLGFALIGAAVFGIGWGLYIAVDMALFASFLPRDAASGTLLGVANAAQTLPQVVAPLVAAPLVTQGGGFPALYVCAAVVALLGVACLAPLRGSAKRGLPGDPAVGMVDGIAGGMAGGPTGESTGGATAPPGPEAA